MGFLPEVAGRLTIATDVSNPEYLLDNRDGIYTRSFSSKDKPAMSEGKVTRYAGKQATVAGCHGKVLKWRYAAAVRPKTNRSVTGNIIR